MAKKKKNPFSVDAFLSTVAAGRTIATYLKNQNVFAQGEPADSVFYIQEGKVKISVISSGEKRPSSPFTRTEISSEKVA
jgi:CRP/FNR family transcriptional regulator, cyclic AMP receptor protein